MTIEHVFERPRTQEPARTPRRELTEIDFPSEEPFEEHVAVTRRHSKACTTLELVIEEECKDVSVGADQFVYFDPTDPKKCLAPDVFVKLGARVKDFDSWWTWLRGTPDLAVEIVSDSDRQKLTWEEKFARYEESGIRELVRFDPRQEMTTRVWDRVGDKLVERAPDSTDTFECKTLDLYWTIEMDLDYGCQLRLCRDREGKVLLPTPKETILRLAEQLAEARAARSSVEHERLMAEQKQRDAEQKQRDEAMARARAEAELERMRAEIDSLRRQVG